jgi:hypothetical protein
MHMEMPGMGKMATGFDGTHGWVSNAVTGPQLLQGKELQQAVRQADFDASMELSKAFPTMETVERATVDGKACHRVRMISAQNDTISTCFDVESGLMTSMDMKQVSQMGEIAVSTRMLDYKDFGGVKMPTRSVTTMAGQEMVTTVKSVTYEPIPDAEFTPPAEIRALITGAAPKN